MYCKPVPAYKLPFVLNWPAKLKQIDLAFYNLEKLSADLLLEYISVKRCVL